MHLSPARRTLLNQIGLVILVAGFCLGGLIYWSAPPDKDGDSSYSVDDDASLSPEDTRRYGHDTEMNFGKMGMLVDKGMRSAAKLGEPKPLAITVTIVSILTAVGCFAIGAQGSERGSSQQRLAGKP
ncbi:MAG: hypothetical protein P4L99_12875 [Chthoniobacter sp.]|nr:hypothetical protein [Chthoniobacter sp.]